MTQLTIVYIKQTKSVTYYMLPPCIIPRLVSHRKNTNHLMFREMVIKLYFFLCLRSRQNQLRVDRINKKNMYYNRGYAVYVSVISYL